METFPLLCIVTTGYGYRRVHGKWMSPMTTTTDGYLFFIHTHTLTRSIHSNGKKTDDTRFDCVHSLIFSQTYLFFFSVWFMCGYYSPLHMRHASAVPSFTSLVKFYTYNLPFCRSSIIFSALFSFEEKYMRGRNNKKTEVKHLNKISHKCKPRATP